MHQRENASFPLTEYERAIISSRSKIYSPAINGSEVSEGPSSTLTHTAAQEKIRVRQEFEPRAKKGVGKKKGKKKPINRSLRGGRGTKENIMLPTFPEQSCVFLFLRISAANHAQVIPSTELKQHTRCRLVLFYEGGCAHATYIFCLSCRRLAGHLVVPSLLFCADSARQASLGAQADDVRQHILSCQWPSRANSDSFILYLAFFHRACCYSKGRPESCAFLFGTRICRDISVMERLWG